MAPGVGENICTTWYDDLARRRVHDTVTSAVCGVSVCAWACVACGSDHILVKECAACYLFTLRRALPACTSSGLPGVL